MPPSRRAALSDSDRAEWAAFARHVRAMPGRLTSGRPTPGRKPPQPPIPPAPPAPPLPAGADAGQGAGIPAAAPAPVKARALTALSVGAAPAGLDRASWKRLREGRLRPQRTLDLHGRTAHSAYHALHGFLRAAHADQVRCVEVITGRGAGEAGGVIRRELPLWLNQPPLRPLVLAAVHPHPANAGAVRLLLRRGR